MILSVPQSWQLLPFVFAFADAFQDREARLFGVGNRRRFGRTEFGENLAHRLFAVPIPQQEKSLSPETIAGTAERLGIAAQRCTSIAESLTAVGQLALDPPPRILITGSLYLAGEVLKLNGTLPN